MSGEVEVLGNFVDQRFTINKCSGHSDLELIGHGQSTGAPDFVLVHQTFARV